MSILKKNFGSLLFSNFAVQGLRFLTIAMIGRRLGAQLFGVYNYILVVVGFGFILVEFGLRNFGIRELAQGRGSLKLLTQILMARLGLSVLGCAGVVALSYSAFLDTSVFRPAFFLGASLFADALLLDFVVVSAERLTVQAVANLAQALFFYGGCYFLVVPDRGLGTVSQIFLLSHILWMLIYLVAANPLKTLPHKSAHDRKVLSVLKEGAPYLTAHLLGMLQVSSGVLFLGLFHFSIWLGDFGAATKILGVALGVINALVAALQPRIAKKAHDLKSKDLGELLYASSRLIWIFLAPTLIVCWFAGPELVQICFGNQFSTAGEFIRPLSLVLAFNVLSLPALYALQLSLETKKMIRTVAMNAATSVLVTVVVLYLGRPLILPWALAVSEFINLIRSWWSYSRRSFFALEDLQVFSLPSLMMSAVFFTQLSSVAKLSLATAVYLLGLALMRIWNRPWSRL